MPSVSILYASTSGHTEYVAGVLVDVLKGKADATMKRIEFAKTEDLTGSDLVVLASSTWNTNNVEGQLNPHMFHFLMDSAKDVDLKAHKIAVIGLGDERYHYTCKAADHIEHFVKTHGGTLVSTLHILNEPYGQDATIAAWANQLKIEN